MRRLRGFIDATFDAIEATTDLGERTHDAVVERSRRWCGPVANVETAISGVVFETIREVSRVTRRAVNGAADVMPAIPADADAPASRHVDQVEAAINGLWGDTLARRGSPLDLSMTIRRNGRVIRIEPGAVAAAFPGATPKLCVFVHGLAATERLWGVSSRAHYGEPGVTFGSRLRDELGLTPVYVRYNTGRHVSENGRALDRLLDALRSAYPVPIDQIVLVGHSMGGLVARSAAHHARERDASWIGALRHVVCIASPHLGAPLEKAANLAAGLLRGVDVAGARVPGELLTTRSAGIKDLRHGYTVDEEWVDRDPDEIFTDARRDLPPVDGVSYSFVATTITRDPEHPLGRLVGDLLVRLPSATGDASGPARRVRFTDGAVVPGMSHTAAANHPAVYEAVRGLLTNRP